MTELTGLPDWAAPRHPVARTWRDAPVTPSRALAEASAKQSAIEDKLEGALDLILLKDQIIRILEKTDSDWRSAESLARQLGTSPSRIKRAAAMSTEIRRPVIQPREGSLDLYRLASRPLTWQERLRSVLLILARQAR